MEQNLPRRLARFYRTQNTPSQGSYSLNEPQEEERVIHSFKQEPQRPHQEEEVRGLPTMEYNDVNLEADRKNMEELHKIQQKNLVEKLALEEVEKFKVQNKRMPNPKEEEQIAENLFKQLKNEPQESQGGANESRRASRRRGRDSNQEGQMENQPQQTQKGVAQAPTQNESPSDVTSVKDLFGEEENTKTVGKEKDEFDISLGELDENESKASGSDEVEDIEEIGNEDNKTCPHCKKSTEKIIYCAKCGTAFCLTCAKTQGADKLCPKCGTKVKL